MAELSEIPRRAQVNLRCRLPGLPPPGRAVTDGERTTFVLRTPRARDVLATGCSLDLHPRSFAAGDCAQTDLGRANVVLHQVDDTPTYELLVAGSYAAYVAAWLAGALEDHA